MAALSDDDRRRFRKQVEGLGAIEVSEAPSRDAVIREVARANVYRAQHGLAPVDFGHDDEQEPPELGFYRRARALGLVRRGR